MKVLHTSDWHIGRMLYGRKRYDEFETFLDWLYNIIKSEGIDVLLVAGDIFDTRTPSHRSQQLYYRFLCKTANSNCRHIVIIAGNHDSPSFLNAPKEILHALNIYVVGSMTQCLEDEVIVLNDQQSNPEAIVCAVPYLRDKDIRTVEPGETIEDKNNKLIKGIQDHYEKVCKLAENKQRQFKNKKDIPIIAMGHLFTSGGKVLDGDGVRDLYIGSLAHISRSIFPKSINYLALGHLHVPQCVEDSKYMRYSGSPIPMGYNEAYQKKQIITIEFKGTHPIIKEISIPSFQALERITGSLDEIQKQIDQLKHKQSCAWLEIEYTGSEVINNIQERIDEFLDGSSLEVLRIKNKKVADQFIKATFVDEALDDLNENDVFERYLDSCQVPDEDREDIRHTYREIVQSVHENDDNKE